MNGQPGSLKRDQEHLRDELRGEGRTWVEVAAVFRQRYRVNARVAFRLAHGWSQRQTADEWNKRWPDELRTLKNFSTWERWPGLTGHEPSLTTLGRLARLYECSVSDLLTDLPDYRHLDNAHQLSPGVWRRPTRANAVETVTGDEVMPGGETETFLLDLLRDRRRLQEINFSDLAKVVVMWLQGFNPNVNRRNLLAKLGAAMTLAAAAPMFDQAGGEEQERVTRVGQGTARIDEPALAHCEQMVGNLLHQKNVIGAQLTLQSAMAYRDMLRQAVTSAQVAHVSRISSVYAQFTDLIGWLCTDMCDYRAAQYYFDDARTAAHDAQNSELVTFILGNMSGMARWQGTPRAGVDHAVAAHAWASRTGSSRAGAYAAASLAETYAADHQADECRRALDAEQAAYEKFDVELSDRAWWHFYDESYREALRCHCALLLGDNKDALAAVTSSLPLTDPTNTYRVAFLKLWRSEALIQQQEIADASHSLGDVATLAAVNMWPKVDQQLTRLRKALTPWQRNKSVRELDEILTERITQRSPRTLPNQSL